MLCCRVVTESCRGLFVDDWILGEGRVRSSYDVDKEQKEIADSEQIAQEKSKTFSKSLKRGLHSIPYF